MAPILLPIAGMYPDVTKEQLLAPPPMEKPPVGSWNFNFINSDAAPMGFVAIENNELLMHHQSVVVMVSQSSLLNVDMADGESREVLVVVDRADAAVTDPSEMDDRKFYAFSDPSGQVHVRWVEAVPTGWEILGRVIMVKLPFISKGQSSGFAEEDDDFEF